MKWIALAAILAVLIWSLWWMTGKIMDAVFDAYDAIGKRKDDKP